MYSLWLMFSCLYIICHHAIAKPNSSNVECVDIYKQPAFQDPSMKNHRISKFALQSMLESDEKNIENIVSETIKCPKGQVPIHKPVNNITDDIIHPDHLSKPGRVLAQQRKGEETSFHYASLTPKLDPGKMLNGAKATFGICAPNVTIQKGQFSKAAIWIINAKENNIYNSIQFGWAVHPSLYGDNIPRLTVYWAKKRGEGCYNTNCGGFVQTHDKLHLGMPFRDIMQFNRTRPSPGQKLSELIKQRTNYQTLAVQLNELREWSLFMGDNRIGYWPAMFFPEMSGGANKVSYGGFVATAPATVSPPMGSGAFPKDIEPSYYMLGLKLTTNNNDFKDIDPNKISVASDRPKCYRIIYRENRNAILFGGPGGQCN